MAGSPTGRCFVRIVIEGQPGDHKKEPLQGKELNAKCLDLPFDSTSAREVEQLYQLCQHSYTSAQSGAHT